MRFCSFLLGQMKFHHCFLPEKMFLVTLWKRSRLATWNERQKRKIFGEIHLTEHFTFLPFILWDWQCSFERT